MKLLSRAQVPALARVLWFLLGLTALMVQAATPSVTAGKGTRGYSVALKSDGSVLAWGDDSDGQLGTGRQLSLPVPTRVDGESGFVALSTMGIHVAALKADGTVWTWGDNNAGQLGDGSTLWRTRPLQVAGLSGVVGVAAASTPLLGLQLVEARTFAWKSDGTVWAWGSNLRGELGDGTTTDRLTPVEVRGLTGVIALSATETHTVAVKSDGTVWAWGSNSEGQLGSELTDICGAHPVQVQCSMTPVQVTALSGVVAVATGRGHTLALKRDGRVWAWGSGGSGQLGNGNIVPRSTPVEVSGLTGVVALAASGEHSVALKEDGTVWEWGATVFQVQSTPTRVVGLTGVVSISSGLGHTVARLGDGSVWAWGDNSYRQLGHGAAAGTPVAVQINGMAAATAVSAGNWNTFALKGDGSVWAWGRVSSPSFGIATSRSAPAAVSGMTDAVAICAGDIYTMALKSDGTVWAWGGNQAGQLGDGTTMPRSVPRPVSDLAGIVGIACGEFHAVALRSDGSVWTWGSNQSGQLGDSTVGFRLIPGRVPGLADVVAVAAGYGHTVALKREGVVWTWGSNNAGQLGDGTTTARLSPGPVPSLSGVTAIVASEISTFALKGDGSVWEWGLNVSGPPRSTPAQVNGLTGVVALAMGTAAVAARTDGTVWAWGTNCYDMLGGGPEVATRSTPVQISGLTGVVGVAAATCHILALKADGTVRGLGRNDYGQLGDGTFAGRVKPGLVVRDDGGASIEGGDWFLDLDPSIPKTIPPEELPSFLVVASGEITQADARMKFRARDVGTTGSVFVFARAPANIVRSAADGTPPLVLGKARSRGGMKANGVACVLAQLNASGQLVAVTAAQLQAYVSGTLSAQGASVPILNNVPASNVAGSTFYVGYGANSSAMLNGGINRSVVSLPGARECRPQAPQTGWWWNPAEGGRGYSLEVRGNNLFFAAFLYDVSGRSTWHVSTGPVSLDGSYYNGDLLSARGGQTLAGPYPGFPSLTSAGSLILAFDDASHGTLSWPGGTLPIERFNIMPGGLASTPLANQPENGWWWNPAESGRGFFIEWQNGSGGPQADLVGYLYDDSGNPVWYLSVNSTPDATRFSGNWWSYANGQTLTGTYRPATRINDNVAAVTIQFTSATTATMTLPGGRTTQLVRHRF